MPFLFVGLAVAAVAGLTLFFAKNGAGGGDPATLAAVMAACVHADGCTSAKSQAAVSAFQRAAGMTVTGCYDTATALRAGTLVDPSTLPAVCNCNASVGLSLPPIKLTAPPRLTLKPIVLKPRAALNTKTQ